MIDDFIKMLGEESQIYYNTLTAEQKGMFRLAFNLGREYELDRVKQIDEEFDKARANA